MPIYPRIQPKLPRLIELLAFPEVQILDVTGPLQVFATANDMTGGKIPPYAIHVVSKTGGAVASSSGVGLLAAALPPHDSTLDTLIITGGPGIEAAAADEALVDWCEDVRVKHAGSRPFAPEHSSWRRPACWMVAGPRPTGRSALNWPNASR
jgi:transcriptional regulator GlxA family with amidase domain